MPDVYTPNSDDLNEELENDDSEDFPISEDWDDEE